MRTVFGVLFYCVFVSGAAFAQHAPVDEKADLVVVISGLRSDASKAQIEQRSKFRSGNSGAYHLMIQFKNRGDRVRFFNWNGTDAGEFTKQKARGPTAIADFIRDCYAESKPNRLILVGHSWGGHTMLEVADLLRGDSTENLPKISVAMAFAIDASSLSRGGRIKKLPDNIQKLVSYYTANAFCWGEWKNEPRITNISLGDPANGFMVNGHPKYSALLDPGAHNAAEWDEKIHADIIKRATAK